MDAITKDIGPFTPLPQGVLDFLEHYHKGGTGDEHCSSCNAACCSQGGFALLENVVLIHKAYERGLLKRKDYDYTPDLSFGDFVFTYFDVRTYSAGESDIVLFHMRNLDFGNRIIGLPDEGSYWETRAKLFEETKGLNRGCVFLSEKTGKVPSEDDNTERGCILHVPESPDHLTAKPIDCLLFTCTDAPRHYKKPHAAETRQWMQLLAESFPNSIDRLKEMLSASKK